MNTLTMAGIHRECHVSKRMPINQPNQPTGFHISIRMVPKRTTNHPIVMRRRWRASCSLTEALLLPCLKALSYASLKAFKALPIAPSGWFLSITAALPRPNLAYLEGGKDLLVLLLLMLAGSCYRIGRSGCGNLLV